MTKIVLIADYQNPRHRSDIEILMDAYAMDPMGGSRSLSALVKSNLVAELSRMNYALPFCVTAATKQ